MDGAASPRLRLHRRSAAQPWHVGHDAHLSGRRLAHSSRGQRSPSSMDPPLGLGSNRGSVPAGGHGGHADAQPKRVNAAPRRRGGLAPHLPRLRARSEYSSPSVPARCRSLRVTRPRRPTNAPLAQPALGYRLTPRSTTMSSLRPRMPPSSAISPLPHRQRSESQPPLLYWLPVSLN